MAGANAWRQQPGGFTDKLTQPGRRVRSLSSMLDSPQQPTASPYDIRTLASSKGELESESELVGLGEDLALLFCCDGTKGSHLGAPAKRVGERISSGGELLTDLFPTGFTSSALSPPPGATSSSVEQLGGGNPALVGGQEQETKRRQVWACVFPSVPATPGAVASSPQQNCATDGEESISRQPLKIDKAQGEHDPHERSWSCSTHRAEKCELERLYRSGSDAGRTVGDKTLETESRLVASPATAAAANGMIFGSDEVHPLGGLDGSEGETTNPAVMVRKREDDLKHALDRLVPRLLQSEDRVKFLEAGLQRAKQAESGRNALIKQATALQEEANHLRHRLGIRHAEALEWGENRRSLEEDNARLRAELHSAVASNTCLETESRHKDSLLAEARSTADAWAERNMTFEAELRHKNQLLLEAEREKKRAWQTTNASAETAKVAVMRAEAAVKKASDLRKFRGDLSRQGPTISNVDVAGSSSEKQRRNVRGQSLADAVAAAAADGGGGPEATSLGWRHTEAELPMTKEDGSRWRARSRSPDRRGVMDLTKACAANAIAPHTNNELGRNFSEDLREASNHNSRAASRIYPPAAVAANQTAGAVVVDESKQTSLGWRNDMEGPPLLTEAQDSRARTATSPGTGRRNCIVLETPSPVARSAGLDGDKQRHDSDGVRGALTGASPAWADAPSSPTSPVGMGVCDYRGRGSHGGRSLGGIGRNIADGTGTLPENSGRFEDDQSGGRERRDYGKGREVYAGRNVGEARLGREERAGGGVDALLVDPPLLVTVDPSPAASAGWDLGAMSPRTCPAAPAGQRRGRDSMSSRRSSLSGAGAGVTVLTKAAKTAGRVGPGHQSEEGQRASTDVNTANKAGDDGDPRVQAMSCDESAKHGGLSPDGAAAYSVGANSVSWAGQQAPLDSARTMTSGADRRQSTRPGSPARLSTVSLASLLGNEGDHRDFAKRDKGHRGSRRSAPFATDEEEDELRPLREMERRLMLLQMEMSQLEAEQNKLAPKASKTIQARVQMQELDSRIASLANESSKLRRVLREKPWRL